MAKKNISGILVALSHLWQYHMKRNHHSLTWIFNSKDFNCSQEGNFVVLKKLCLNLISFSHQQYHYIVKIQQIKRFFFIHKLTRRWVESMDTIHIKWRVFMLIKKHFHFSFVLLTNLLWLNFYLTVIFH